MAGSTLFLARLVASFVPVKNQNIYQIGSPLDGFQLDVETSFYGRSIPKIRGRCRVIGNMIWARDIEVVETVTPSDSNPSPGAAGGKGGIVAVLDFNFVKTFSYVGTFAVAVGAGEISDIIKIWADTKLIYDIASTSREVLIESGKLPMIKYYGSADQLPSSVIESFDGAGNVPAYRDLAYVVFNKLPLADFGNRVPDFTFEVQG